MTTHVDLVPVHTGRYVHTRGVFEHTHTERRVGREGVSATHQHQDTLHTNNTQRTNAQHTTQNTQGVIASSALPKFCPSSNHSLYLIKLFNSCWDIALRRESVVKWFALSFAPFLQANSRRFVSTFPCRCYFLLPSPR